jgi:hypothetical protein
MERRLQIHISILRLITALALVLPGGALLADRLVTAAYDSVPWSFTTNQPVIAIGDIHGDLSALATILTQRALVDQAGNWSGGGKHLVLMGDLLDRGPDGRWVMDWVMQLEAQARSAGGRVHTLIGNHEVMVLQGDVRYTTAGEHRSFMDWADLPSTRQLARDLKSTPEKTAIVGAMRYSPPYQDWIASRNAIVKINRTLFVHGGLEDWGSSISLGAINSSIRQLIRNLQGRTSNALELKWVIDQKGPIWTREMAEGRMENSSVAKLLRRHEIDQIVVGHTPTTSGKIERIYDGAVVKIDTGISSYYGGELGSLTLTPEGKVRALHVERLAQPHPLRQDLIRDLRSPCSLLVARR